MRQFVFALLGLALAAVPARAADPTIASLEAEVHQLSERLDASTSRFKLSGYVDAGFFAPEGNGKGFVPDVANTQRSRFDVPWILLGDPWSTAVNSRGEPANTQGSFAIPFDSIQSGGHSSFIINQITTDLWGKLASNASVNASIDFLPRTGTGGQEGDMIDAKLAFLRWQPWEDRDVTLEAGKYRSAFGLEYRRQESPDRTEVTPSLIYRYVGGHPLGVKVRSRWVDDQKDEWNLNLSLQNGNSHIETFTFAEEIDHNDAKTLTARLGHRWRSIPGITNLELGVSAEYGAQSGQPSSDVDEHQFGADLSFEKGDFDFLAEAVKGDADGGGLVAAPSLDFRGAYFLASYHATNELTPYARWGFRKATQVGDTFAYVIDIARLTIGLRYEINPQWLIKAEYLDNFERGPVPDIDNNVFTTSMVMSF